jgi:hypothetical protein
MSIIGFRRWRVSAAGELVGLGVPHVWESAAQTAICRGLDGVGFGNCAPFRVWPGHPVPSLRSRCGIWAHRQPIRECQCGQPTAPAHGAVGAVRLWGRYVEHESGWRAERARVVALVDFTGRMGPGYDAPRYPDLASLYGEWAPDASGWAPGEATVWCDPDLALPAAISFLQYAVQVGTDLQRTVARTNVLLQAGMKPLLERLLRLADGPGPPDRGAGDDRGAGFDRGGDSRADGDDPGASGAGGDEGRGGGGGRRE